MTFYAFYSCIYIFIVIYQYQHFQYRYINIPPDIDIIDIFWYFFDHYHVVNPNLIVNLSAPYKKCQL